MPAEDTWFCVRPAPSKCADMDDGSYIVAIQGHLPTPEATAATTYPVTKCGDTLLDRGDPECHHKMRVRWLATECTRVMDKL
jgi:hypothetical protein